MAAGATDRARRALGARRFRRRGRRLSEPADSCGRALAARRAHRRGRAGAVPGDIGDAASAGRDRQQGRRNRRARQRLRGQGRAGRLHHRRCRHRVPFAGEDRQRQAAVRSAQGLPPDHRIWPLSGRHFRRQRARSPTSPSSSPRRERPRTAFRSACRASASVSHLYAQLLANKTGSQADLRALPRRCAGPPRSFGRQHPRHRFDAGLRPDRRRQGAPDRLDRHATLAADAERADLCRGRLPRSGRVHRMGICRARRHARRGRENPERSHQPGAPIGAGQADHGRQRLFPKRWNPDALWSVFAKQIRNSAR